MGNLHLEHAPVAKTGMLIRKPVADVFEAFIDPNITAKFLKILLEHNVRLNLVADCFPDGPGEPYPMNESVSREGLLTSAWQSTVLRPRLIPAMDVRSDE